MPWEPLPGKSDHVTPLRAGIDRLMANLGSPPVDVRRILDEAWTDIVGPAMAAHARAGSITGGVLAVMVDAPAWASEIGWLESDIVRRCDELLGPGVVDAVTVRVS